MNRKIIETDIEALAKTAKAIENKQELKLKQAIQQYNQVVAQNKNLQIELNVYKKTLAKIQTVTEEYITNCAGFTCEGMEEIQNEIIGVLV